MQVYKVGRTKYAHDLTGEGARLFGGRWNKQLTSCIYTSESRSLAVLEYTVNVNIEEIPRALSITTFDIAIDQLQVLSIEDLPGNWRQSPAPSSTKDFGTEFLKRAVLPVIRIPSCIILQEYNFLLNPNHASSKHFTIINVENFVYDVRIKLV